MRHALLLFALTGGLIAFGQSESRVEKKYERYENGELQEEKYYLEENGQAIAGEDFNTPEFDQMQAKLASRQVEMELRLQEIQERSDQMMRKAKQDMNLRMEEMKQRMDEMQLQMDRKMKEQQPFQSPQMSPPTNNSSPNNLGTTFQT